MEMTAHFDSNRIFGAKISTCAVQTSIDSDECRVIEKSFFTRKK